MDEKDCEGDMHGQDLLAVWQDMNHNVMPVNEFVGRAVVSRPPLDRAIT